MYLPKRQSSFLWGARKTGKSTFLRYKYPDALYIDLLQADVFQVYLRAPHRLREELVGINENKLIIIDEVQKVPPLLDEVHWLIENKKNLQFILCGSSSRRIRTSGANLLGGRAWRYKMLPFCYGELKTLDWNRIFNNGLIPDHYFSSNAHNAQKFIASYLFDYLLSEVHIEAQIRKREVFARFIEALGFCQGEMINFSNIARDCGVDNKTVRTYFEVLEDMYLGYFLKPYEKVAKRQTIREKPKFYLFDTGVASYLRRYEFKDFYGADAGKSFEHYLFLELKAYQTYTEKRDTINYWRTKEGHEVDFIVCDRAIEAKISTSISKRDIKGLLVFSEEYNNSDLHVVCLEKRKRIISFDNKKIVVWPVREFLEALWENKFWP